MAGRVLPSPPGLPLRGVRSDTEPSHSRASELSVAFLVDRRVSPPLGTHFLT